MVKNRKSFTLVELIVVMGIASVIFGMVMASFDSFDNGKKLDEEAEIVKSRIEEIVKKTASGDLEGNLGCQQGDNRCDSSHYLFTRTSNTNYSLNFFCTCSGDNVVKSKTIYSQSLKDGITLTSSSNTFTFAKKGPFISDGCITLTKDGKSKSIIFSYPGNVSVGLSCP